MSKVNLDITRYSTNTNGSGLSISASTHVRRFSKIKTATEDITEVAMTFVSLKNTVRDKRTARQQQGGLAAVDATAIFTVIAFMVRIWHDVYSIVFWPIKCFATLATSFIGIANQRAASARCCATGLFRPKVNTDSTRLTNKRTRNTRARVLVTISTVRKYRPIIIRLASPSFHAGGRCHR